MSLRRLALGREGEALAERRLKELGYRILERSARSALGELDLVMEDGATVVFVEVKARGSRRFGLAEEAVDARKRRRLTLLARAYVRDRGLAGRPMRFDVVAVQDGAVRHVKNAFPAEGALWERAPSESNVHATLPRLLAIVSAFLKKL